MNCTRCGQSLPAEAVACPNCGQPTRTSYQPPPPPPPVGSYAPPPPHHGGAAALPSIPNYIIPAIFVTICCCLPLGVVAIIFGIQVNSKLAAGDVAGAMAASKNARTFVIAAVVVGLAVAILSFLMNGAAFLAGISDGFNNR